MRALLVNRGEIDDALLKELYTQPALVPASPWLENAPPGAPNLQMESAQAELRLRWAQSDVRPVWLWVLQTRAGADWTLEIFARQHTGRNFTLGRKPEVIALTAIDRSGNAGSATVFELR